VSFSLFIDFVSRSKPALIWILKAGLIANAAVALGLYHFTAYDAPGAYAPEVTSLIREITSAGRLTDLRWAKAMYAMRSQLGDEAFRKATAQQSFGDGARAALVASLVRWYDGVSRFLKKPFSRRVLTQPPAWKRSPN
jgi:hypothetical protein